MELKDRFLLAKSWVVDAGNNIKDKLKEPLVVEQKSGPNDLVTNLDKETEAFLIGKIREHFPKDSILGEEGLADQAPDLNGSVWVIDPIDGTLNFVKQGENFCVMLAFYEQGKGKLGFIYNVMRDELYAGGETLGVFCNDKVVPTPKNLHLAEGLLGMNAYIYAYDIAHARTIGEKSAGVRISGCAGLEFIEILKGNQVGYYCKLAPWDYAAGAVLLQTLGLKATEPNGKSFDLKGKVGVLAATPNAYQDIVKLAQSQEN